MINIKTGLQELSCEDGKWMELPQDRVQWRALALVVLNLRVLSLQHSLLNNYEYEVISDRFNVVGIGVNYV
jgi:hypothetical protein